MALMISLSKNQKKHMEAIDWLFSDSFRGTGRTHALIVHLLRKLSMPENWGVPIIICDHHHMGGPAMAQRLNDMLYQTNLEYGIDTNNLTVTVTGLKEINETPTIGKDTGSVN